MKFLAIDFETANQKRNSACSVGLVRVENNKLCQQMVYLIKPPETWFEFTHIHGLKWDDVKDAKTFKELWPLIEPMFSGIDVVVAHNAPFDRSVLEACCKHYNIDIPKLEWECSLKLSKQRWKELSGFKLSDICRHLKIDLNHHEALSDALACARIFWAIKNQRT